MNRQRITFLLITITMSFGLFAQSNYRVQRNRELRDSHIDRSNSERQIRELRENILLVRLGTRLPLIEALEQANRHTEAEQIKAAQLKKNKEIIANFRKYFDFCPTYFFYSNYSHYIYDDAIDSVLFLNDKAEVDSTIRMQSDIFYIAEFTSLAPDTAVYAAGTYLSRTPNGLEQRTRYEVSGNFGFGALVFKSREFYQLRRPFPYYSRTLESIPIMRRSHKRVIQRTNEALHYYYNKVLF